MFPQENQKILNGLINILYACMDRPPLVLMNDDPHCIIDQYIQSDAFLILFYFILFYFILFVHYFLH